MTAPRDFTAHHVMKRYMHLCLFIAEMGMFSAPPLPCYNQSRTQLFRHCNERGYVIYSPEKNKEN